MKCPFCNKEMEYGFIQSPQEVSWQPKRRIFASSGFYDDVTVLSERSLIRGSAVVAYNCKKCRKILIDYEDNASDANNLPRKRKNSPEQ